MAEISIDTFCQLTISEMQQQVLDYQKLIDLANQFKNDPEKLQQQESILRVQFDQEKEARYSLYDTTAQEYVLYMGENTDTVNAYLESNSEIKQQMDDLKAQLNTLAEQHAALKETVSRPSAPPLE